MTLHDHFKRLTIEDRKFDIFFIYRTNTETSTWVKETCKKLERIHIVAGYYEKDFMPGSEIPKNIITCLNQSKHVGVVITPDFCHSHWCMYDLEVAMMKVIKSTESKILPLFLNLTDLEKEVPDELQIYIGIDVTGHPEIWWDKFVSAVKDSNQGDAKTIHYHFQKLVEAINDAGIDTAIHSYEALSTSPLGFLERQIGMSYLQKMMLATIGIDFERGSMKFDIAKLFPNTAKDSKIWSLQSVFNEICIDRSLQACLHCSGNEETEKLFTSACEIKFYGINGVDHIKLSFAFNTQQEIQFTFGEQKVLIISNERTTSVVSRLSQSDACVHFRSKRSQKIKRLFNGRNISTHSSRGYKNYRNYRKVLFKFPCNRISGRYTFYRDNFRAPIPSRQNQQVTDNEAYLLVQNFENSHKALIF